jgi:hypothetical protein
MYQTTELEGNIAKTRTVDIKPAPHRIALFCCRLDRRLLSTVLVLIFTVTPAEIFNSAQVIIFAVPTPTLFNCPLDHLHFAHVVGLEIMFFEIAWVALSSHHARVFIQVHEHGIIFGV